MKYLIIGRSGCGKDYLAKKLEEHGLNLLQSYTTRPKRHPDETSHVFITPEQAATYTDKVARTVVNGYEYFATRKQVEDCDIYIIDPIGMKELLANMPDTCFHIIHVTTHDELKREEMALSRSDNPDAEKAVYDKRIADEDAQFSDFEAILNDEDSAIADNCFAIHPFVNDYEENTAKMFAAHMVATLDLHNNITTIIDHCIRLGILTSNIPNTVSAAFECEHCGMTYRDIPYDIFADITIAYPEGFNHVLMSYLANPLELRLPYDCDKCQREDAPCDTCSRNIKNRNNPNTTDEYYNENEKTV